MMPSLLLIQWGVVGFFIVMHFLIGFIRGTSKSTYFTIVNILMTIVTLLLISLISLNLILSPSFTFQDLVIRIQNMSGNIIPEDVVTYITDPALTGFIVAIIDLVLRIVGFFTLYPIIKGFFTLIIFRPIWSFGIKKSLLRKQNEKLQIEFNEKQTGKKKFVPTKRLKKNISSRFFGGTIGAVNGLVVAFIFLLPVLVMASFISGFNDTVTVANHHSITELSTTNEELITIPNEIQQYLNEVAEMNEKGFSSITRQIVVQGKPIDRLIFDMIFTTYVVEDEEKTPINFIGELEGLVGIAEVIYTGGYLEDDFDYRDISSDNLGDIEKIFGHIGNSNLIGYMIPFATKYGVEKFLPDYIDGVNLYDRQGSAAALDEFTSIDWSDEFSNIYGIVEAILEFGSVAEILNYANNPELMLELSPDEGVRLANIIRAVGEMETFSLLSAAADYATTLTEIQQEISWMDPAEVEGYLQYKLSFIIDNPKFFTGENGEISRIANLIEAIYSDEFGDVNLVELVNSINDPETFLENQNADWTGSLLEKIVEIQLLIESIPIGVDYGVYNTLGDQIERELADQISESLNEVGWDDEILNVGEIYKEVLKLGLARAFGVEPDYFGIVDDIAINHMGSVRTIVEKIFEESQVVNTAIELASPIIVDTVIQDQELKELVNEALISDPDSGVVDFRFGQEVNNLLTLAESIYLFTTATQLVNISSMTQDAQIELFAGFGSLTQTQYGKLTSAIEELQIFERTGASGLEYAKNRFEIEQLYIPEEVQLGQELSSIVGFIYYAASYTYDNRLNYYSYEEIDFAPLLADEIFRSHLLATELENHSHLLLSNIAHNLMIYAGDQAISQYLAIPENLSIASPESEDWMDELNALLGAVFDLGASFQGSEAITLSFRDVVTLAEDPMSAPISLITQFQDIVRANDAFGSLDASQILRTSIVNAIDNLGPTLTANLNGYELKTPEVARDGNMIKIGMIVELIHGLATVIDDANNTLNYQTFADISSTTYMYDYVKAYNNLADASLETLADITLLRGFISDALLSPDLQAYARDIVNNSGNITVSDGFLAFEREDNVLSTSDLSELFISVKSMQVTEPFYANPGAGIYAFLQTFDDEKLDKVFDATILKEIFTFALTDPEALQSLAGIVETAYSGAQSTTTFLGAINPRFLPIVSALGTYKDEDDLFDVNEIKALIRAFNNLNIDSSADLSALSDLNTIHRKVRNTTVIENLFDSNWLYDQVNYVFTNDLFLEELAEIASQQVFNQTGLDKEFTKEDVSFALDKYDMIEVGGRREGGVKVVEIKKFILSGTRLDWGALELGTGAGIASNLSAILMQDGTDGERHIDVILESNLLVAIFDKLLNFEYNGIGMDEVAIAFLNTKLEGVEALEGLQLQKEFLHYDTRAYDENEVLRREEIIEMIEAVSFVDLTQTIGIPTFYQMIEDDTFDEIFDSYILHSLISNALTNEDVQQLGITKANNAQEIVELANDFLAVDPILMDGDLFKSEEIKNILIALNTMGLTDSAGFNSIGLATFSELNGRNVDIDTGEDDFDRVFSAGYIYIILDRALKLESLGDYVGTMLGNALDTTIEDLDTTPSDAMLGTILDSEIEADRVTKAEFRRMFTSFGLLGDIGGIGLGTFTNMVDTAAPSDDFTTFIASDYIYTILARLFDHPAFGDYVGDMLSGAFGDDDVDLDMTPPSDSKGTVVGDVEEGLITKYELRQMMISFKFLGLDDGTDITVETIMNLVGEDSDENGEDDFDQFLESIYIRDKVSILLMSDSVIEKLADGRFTPEAFRLLIPETATENVDDRDRLTKIEIYDLFNGLKILGVTDLEGSNIGLDTITDLEDAEVLQVLESSYLYVTIHLMLDTEENLNVPLDAYEEDGDYEGLVKKNEIVNLLNAFDVLGTSNPDEIDANTISIAELKDLLDLNSVIIDQIISDAVVDALDSVPTSSYNDDQTRLLKSELYNLVEVLLILADGDDTQTLASLTPIDTDAITRAKLRELYDLDSRLVDRILSQSIIDSGISIHSLSYDEDSEVDEFDNKLDLKRSELLAMIDALDILEIEIADADVIDTTKLTPDNIDALLDLESPIIYRLVGENIIDQDLHTDESIAEAGDNNYDPELPGSDVKISEMYALVEAMRVLGIANLSEEIDVDNTTIAQLQLLHYIGLGIDPVEDLHQSLIVHRLLSESIIGALEIPTDAYMVGSLLDLVPDEIQGVIGSLLVLSGGDDTETLAGLTPIDTSLLTPDDIESLLDLESLIIYRTVASGIIDQNLQTDESLAEDGDINYDENAIGSDIKVPEMYALVEAMRVMNIVNLGTTIDIDTTTIAQLQQLHYLGLGIDPIEDKYESVIVHRLLSEAIIDALVIPTDAYMTGTILDLVPDEIQGVITSLLVLSNGDDTETLLGLTPVDTTVLTPDAIEEILDTNTLINYRMVADGIIDMNLQTDESLAEVGDFNYDENAIGSDIKISEMYALVEAMRVMGIINLGTPINTEDATIANLQQLHYLGLGTDPIQDVYNSVIVHRLLSEGIIESLNIPTDAFMDAMQLDLVPDEIQGVIDALLLISDGDDTQTLNDLTPVANSTLTPDLIEGLLDLDKLIIYRLIAEGIIDAELDTLESHAELGDANYDENAIGLDIKVIEMYALVEAMRIMDIIDLSVTIDATGVEIAQLQALHYVGLGEDPIDDVYNSRIVHRILSDGIISSLDIPTNAYMSIAQLDLTPEEVQGVIDALLEINGNDDTGKLANLTPIDDSLLTSTVLANLIAIDTLIVYRLIADGIITAGIATDDSYAVDGDVNFDSNDANADIKIDEMNHIVASMDILGITNILTVASDIAAFDFTSLDDTQIETLVEADTDGPNTIIYYIISETLDPDNDVFDMLVLYDPVEYPGPADDYYELDELDNRLRLKRASIKDVIDYLKSL
ncbi:hypothetical protein [Peloplasma aerotolerans]|uniref:EF-hand domain-containing protein n=1 Tax=Peloplasma aerotolerans TaxID=3044389 RepID=A0AAW6U6Z8_9MOLU|nr:hypothetical protein [Mariniplasma sp. M4Ah]MDI6452695.1 hypothetical protein [Mariniplasma sp. M4Ah]